MTILREQLKSVLLIEHNMQFNEQHCDAQPAETGQTKVKAEQMRSNSTTTTKMLDLLLDAGGSRVYAPDDAATPVLKKRKSSATDKVMDFTDLPGLIDSDDEGMNSPSYILC